MVNNLQSEIYTIAPINVCVDVPNAYAPLSGLQIDAVGAGSQNPVKAAHFSDSRCKQENHQRSLESGAPE